jgi:outer membrane receptor protein involved in Fe transport
VNISRYSKLALIEYCSYSGEFSMSISKRLHGLFLLAGISIQSLAIAEAQTSVPPPAAANSDVTLDEILVTGSRIARSNLDAPVPITVLSGDTLVESGNVSLGDVLNNLPSLRSTFSSANSGRFIGTVGVSALDLRGLGTQRTLVLINGRRQVSSFQGSSEVDLNTIPTDLIERTEIITGGASAVYGSDAISGVVNFILKKNFTGLELRAQNGISGHGDAHDFFVSGTYGIKLGDRGNVAVSVEYSQQDSLRLSERTFSRTFNAFTVNPANPTPDDNVAGGVPDLVLVTDRRSIVYSNGGTICVQANCRNPARPIFQFQPNGSLAPINLGTRDFRPGARVTEGGSGLNFNTNGQLLPDLNRLSINLLTHYELTDAVDFFLEAKFVQTHSIGAGSPSFNGPGFGVTVGSDNPYLTPQALTTLQAAYDGSQDSYTLYRNNNDLGERTDDANRELVRIAAGIRGSLSDNFNYELSYVFGRSTLNLKYLNNRIEQRFAYAADAVRDVAGVLGKPGAIVCRAQLDGVVANSFDPAEVSGCVPANVFGDGNISPAARNYINTTSSSSNTLDQHVATAFVSGSSKGWFELPGGPIGVALGVEYRSEKSTFVPDDFLATIDPNTGSGVTFLNALQKETGSYNVKEAFFEGSIPLLADMPFVKELTMSGAGRVAKYNGKTGTVFAWKADVIYAPISDIRFRASLSRAVRAPNITEQFGPDVQNFFSVTDPCSVEEIANGTSTRAANCVALGIPVGFVSDLAATPTGTSGGNPDLKAEKSRSFTAGVLLTPGFVPNFSFSADYYRIRITDAISSVGAQDILDQCVDGATITNIYCPLVTRDATKNISFIKQRSLNFSKLEAEGVDMDLNYRLLTDSYGDFNFRGLATLIIKRNDFPFVAEPNRPDQVLGELGDPKFQFNLSVDWKYKGFGVYYEFRHISNQLQGGVNAEDVYTVGGRPPQNPDAQDLLFTGTTSYSDLRLSYDFSEKARFYMGVNNLFDREPPPGLDGTGGGSGIYDNIGRKFYAGIKLKL